MSAGSYLINALFNGEAVQDSNCLNLHKSIDLLGLLGCPVVSIHLWMHAYSKLQCPQAELWMVCRSASHMRRTVKGSDQRPIWCSLYLRRYMMALITSISSPKCHLSMLSFIFLSWKMVKFRMKIHDLVKRSQIHN